MEISANFLFFELLKFTLFLGVCLFSAIVVFIVIEKNTYSVRVRTYTRVSTGKEFRRNFYIPYLQTFLLEDAHVFEIYSHENVHVRYLYVYGIPVRVHFHVQHTLWKLGSVNIRTGSSLKFRRTL